MNRLIANRWQTPDGTILWSKHTHDMVCHRDKNGELYFTDGGNEYVRRSLNLLAPMKNLCVYTNGTFELEREWVLWGRNYDKDMNRLKETQWIPIKDLDTDHIYKILEIDGIANSYRRLMEEEIIYREEQILKSYEQRRKSK